jgi:DNA-binding beta-propeller fold protein YncE
MNKIGGYTTTGYNANGGGAEITAFDPGSDRLYVANGSNNTVSVLNMSNPTAPTLITTLNFAGIGSPNSVAIMNGVVAIALEAPVKTNNGSVHFFNAANNTFLTSASVGALPDMLTFSPDGTKLLVANEGEPSGYGGTNVDPEGSVTIFDVTLNSGAVTINNTFTAGFTSYNGQEAALRSQGIRIFGPGATAAQDFEPEYIAVTSDSTKAYVSLQENNAFAIIDLTLPVPAVTGLKALGYKDHSLPGNKLDASDRDNAAGTGPSINIVNRPVFGMYQPDGIASFTVGGNHYVISANEGDARDYAAVNGGFAFNEESRVSTLDLDNAVFTTTEEATLKGNGPNGIGRLTVTNQLGNDDASPGFEKLYAFGARSFSIWDASGNLVWDSGDQFETFLAGELGQFFNVNHNGSNNNQDDRSDNKGPEPEGIAVGEAYGKLLAFIGLERSCGVLMYDISDPQNPTFLDYLNTRNFGVVPSAAGSGDLGPEGLAFISAADSPNGVPLLVVGNEVSGTVAVFEVVPEPASIGLLAIGGAALLARRRRK